MSKVAVWMPSFNDERYLQAAIDSVLAQTFKDFTLYISDDRSTDDSWGTIKASELKDQRVSIGMPTKFLKGIEHMDFMWKWIGDHSHEYSIHIGDHDLWPTHHLATLIERMESERATCKGVREIAIVYTDTFQMDAQGAIIGRYQDIMQTAGQIGNAMLPQYVISGVNSPQLFGLWNEEVRRRIPIRHCCSGWDHLVVMEAALHGSILFEARTALTMRAPQPGTTLERYGQRHLSEEQLAKGPKDFIDQLEWCLHCVEMGLRSIPEPARPLYRSLLTSSMIATYIALRGLNLNTVPGAMQIFNTDPRVQQIFAAAKHIEVQAMELTWSSHSEA